MSSEYTSYLKARVSAEELAVARQIAEKEGKTVSEIIRERFFGPEPISRKWLALQRARTARWEKEKARKATNAGEKEPEKA